MIFNTYQRMRAKVTYWDGQSPYPTLMTWGIKHYTKSLYEVIKWVKNAKNLLLISYFRTV